MQTSTSSTHVKFIDGPLMGLETDINKKIFDRFLWYEQDDEDMRVYCYCYERVAGPEEGLFRYLRRKEAPQWILTTEEIIEILQ